LEHARYYSAIDREEYFLIYGSFAFENTYWGAILISAAGQMIRGWSMKPQKYGNLNGNIGLALSKTGDLVTNTHGVLASYRCVVVSGGRPIGESGRTRMGRRSFNPMAPMISTTISSIVRGGFIPS